MELRELALRVLDSPSLGGKLDGSGAPWTDANPGPAERRAAPARAETLRIVPGREARVPPAAGMPDPRQRVRILHAFANHELQAVELFAWALLAFPEAPPRFRRGLLGVLREEQGHVRLYLDRLAALGVSLGDFPVSAYFWSKVGSLDTPARFVSAMSLTFENANLDHAQAYASAARAAGDLESAALLDRILRDEIRHVRFGARWLARFKRPDETLWQAYRRNVDWPLRPALARGPEYDARARRAAGLDEEFVAGLAEADRP